MKVPVFIALLSLVCLPAAFGQTTYAVNIGADFFNYTQNEGNATFLNTGFTLLHSLDTGLELNIGVDLGIATKDGNSTTTGKQPVFFVPVNLGINFSFQPVKDSDFFSYIIGIGLTPIFHYDAQMSSTLNFYVGPYLKAGARLKVHSLLKWFIEAKQTLTIGAPYWINTGARLYTGVMFNF